MFKNAGTAGFTWNKTITLQKDTTSEDDGDAGRGLPNYLADIALTPDNQFAYITSKKDNIDRGTFRDGKALTFETTTRSIVSKVNMTTGTELFGSRIDIDNSSQPSAMVFSPLGDYLFVACRATMRSRSLMPSLRASPPCWPRAWRHRGWCLTPPPSACSSTTSTAVR
ncbi:MAG: hypothetical protein HC901_02140 [Bdellovibrionaceae bacterium]|nr:hypothetical protein [Pseudobdellovibrionaceae bacterium]